MLENVDPSLPGCPSIDAVTFVHHPTNSKNSMSQAAVADLPDAELALSISNGKPAGSLTFIQPKNDDMAMRLSQLQQQEDEKKTTPPPTDDEDVSRFMDMMNPSTGATVLAIFVAAACGIAYIVFLALRFAAMLSSPAVTVHTERRTSLFFPSISICPLNTASLYDTSTTEQYADCTYIPANGSNYHGPPPKKCVGLDLGENHSHRFFRPIFFMQDRSHNASCVVIEGTGGPNKVPNVSLGNVQAIMWSSFLSDSPYGMNGVMLSALRADVFNMKYPLDGELSRDSFAFAPKGSAIVMLYTMKEHFYADGKVHITWSLKVNHAPYQVGVASSPGGQTDEWWRPYTVTIALQPETFDVIVTREFYTMDPVDVIGPLCGAFSIALALFVRLRGPGRYDPLGLVDKALLKYRKPSKREVKPEGQGPFFSVSS